MQYDNPGARRCGTYDDCLVDEKYVTSHGIERQVIVKGFGTLLFCCGLGNCLNAQGAFLGFKLGIALGSHQQSLAVVVHATGYSWNLMPVLEVTYLFR